jgi:hypothetical protein
MYSGTIPPRSLFWSCTWIAFVVAVTILWTIEHTEKLRLRKEIEGKKPRLKMTLESTLTEYDKAKDATVFVLSAYLVNAGEPTIASGWNAKYYVGEGVEKMTGWYVTGTYTIKIGAESLTLTNENLLSAQMLNRQLTRGDGRSGRLMFTLSGDRSTQIKACQYKIVVECLDFEGTSCTATFAPDPNPTVGIKMYPGEQLQKVAGELAPSVSPDTAITRIKRLGRVADY